MGEDGRSLLASFLPNILVLHPSSVLGIQERMGRGEDQRIRAIKMRGVIKGRDHRSVRPEEEEEGSVFRFNYEIQ